MKTLLDAFFWRDPYTGKRRPRDLFWATLLALLAVVMAGVALVVFKPYYSAALPPTPTLRPPTATPLPSPTFTPSPVPTATPVPVTEKDKTLAEIASCDPDPANWKMEKIFGNWYRITEPSCALTGLGRAVAWHIATRAMGYTADEAAQVLGYPKGKWPWAPSRTGWVMFKTAGKVGYAPMSLYFAPDVRQWAVADDKGALGSMTLTPRGCYRANWPEGGRIVWWRDKGFPFEVGCFFYEDYTAKTFVYETEQGAGKDNAPVDKRVSVLFAYAQETGWVYLGRIDDEKYNQSIQDWENKFGISVPDDEQHYAEMWHIPLWNVAWVEEAWGMPVKPLPEDWQNGLSKDKLEKAVMGRINYWISWIKQNGAYGVTPPR